MMYDKNAAFQSYIMETENYSVKADRFLDDISIGKVSTLLAWLEAAFAAGAASMAKDTINALYDYGTAVAGIESAPGFVSEAFDCAATNLHSYYEQVLGEGYNE